MTRMDGLLHCLPLTGPLPHLEELELPFEEVHLLQLDLVQQLHKGATISHRVSGCTASLTRTCPPRQTPCSRRTRCADLRRLSSWGRWISGDT